MKEEWKDIKEYEGLYQISNFGRVKSLSRKIWNGKGYYQSKEKILKPGIEKLGYHYFYLCKNNKRKKYLHRLLAEAFIPNLLKLPEVNHKDQNPFNNELNNLEWCTHEYNMNYGDKNERISKKIKKKIIQYTLKGKKIKEWDGIINIEKELKIPSSNITSCCKGKYKKTHGFIFKYKEEI